jgi:hypothetical protein
MSICYNVDIRALGERRVVARDLSRSGGVPDPGIAVFVTKPA